MDNDTDSSLDVFELFHDCVYAVTWSLQDKQLVLFHWQLDAYLQ